MDKIPETLPLPILRACLPGRGAAVALVLLLIIPLV